MTACPRGSACRVERIAHARSFSVRPARPAFQELRELKKLEEEGHGAALVVRKEELELGMTEASVAELKGPAGRPKTRIHKLLHAAAHAEDPAPGERPSSCWHPCPAVRSYMCYAPSPDTAKRVELRFLLNPVRLEADERNGERIGAVVCERTTLEGAPFRQQPVGTNDTETLPADLVLVSIGYRGMTLEGMDEELFDSQRGVVANDHGKVVGENNLFVTVRDVCSPVMFPSCA